MKNPPCQSAWRVSETFWELFSLFSSFLRGASCPKSPRVAATAAPSFMRETHGDVKEKAGEGWVSSEVPTIRPGLCVSIHRAVGGQADSRKTERTQPGRSQMNPETLFQNLTSVSTLITRLWT
jgi:hypothetical protein